MQYLQTPGGAEGLKVSPSRSQTDKQPQNNTPRKNMSASQPRLS